MRGPGGTTQRRATGRARRSCVQVTATTHGQSWRELEVERVFLEERLREGLRLNKIHNLLGRRGVVVPYRTLHRFCVAELEFGRQRTTVRVADGEPGQSCRSTSVAWACSGIQ